MEKCVISVFLAILAVHSSSAMVEFFPNGTVVGEVIQVYQNITNTLPGIEVDRSQCVEDSTVCPNSFLLSSYNAFSQCGNRIICCPLARYAKTIPDYVPVVQRNDITTYPLSPFVLCRCKPITYSFLYLQQEGDEWVTKTVPVHVGYQCDWSNPDCLKFRC